VTSSLFAVPSVVLRLATLNGSLLVIVSHRRCAVLLVDSLAGELTSASIGILFVITIISLAFIFSCFSRSFCMQYDRLLAWYCCSTVRPSVRPSMTLRCALWKNDRLTSYIQQKSLNKWRKCPLRTWFYNFQLPTPIPSTQTPHLLHQWRCCYLANIRIRYITR